MTEENKLGLGRYIDAGFKRQKDKMRVERWFIQLPNEMVKLPDFPFKDGDQLLVQLVGKDRLVITKFKLLPPK